MSREMFCKIKITKQARRNHGCNKLLIYETSHEIEPSQMQKTSHELESLSRRQDVSVDCVSLRYHLYT